MNRKEYLLPVHASGITLEQYQKYITMIQLEDAKDEKYFQSKVCNIYWGMEYDEVKETPLELVSSLTNSFVTLLHQDMPFTRDEMVFKMDVAGEMVEFGFVPNLDKLTFGEYIDLDKYLKDDKNLHKAMAVLFRPIKKKWKDTYSIYKYTGSDAYAEVLKYMPCNIAIGAKVFFWHLTTILQKSTLDYLLHQMKEEQRHKVEQLLEKNGDGIMQLKLSLGMTYLELIKQLELDYIQPSYS